MHSEQQYLDLCRLLLEQPIRQCRGNNETRSIAFTTMQFDLREGFPLFTTKYTWFKGIKEELLFFLSGKTDSKILENNNVNIWKAHSRKEYLQSRNLPYDEGVLGPLYPFQWRHAGEHYIDQHSQYNGIDQIQEVIDNIKSNPYSRRHLVVAWCVADLNKMALPPCHYSFQFYVDNGYIDCIFNMRSVDVFLGLPFNIASYALLLSMVALLTNLKPRMLYASLTNVHLYCKHEDIVKEQITRIPLPYCQLDLPNVNNITQFESYNINVLNYKHCGSLKADIVP